jgi:hypothetical protein
MPVKQTKRSTLIATVHRRLKRGETAEQIAAATRYGSQVVQSLVDEIHEQAKRGNTPDRAPLMPELGIEAIEWTLRRSYWNPNGNKVSLPKVAFQQGATCLNGDDHDS